MTTDTDEKVFKAVQPQYSRRQRGYIGGEGSPPLVKEGDSSSGEDDADDKFYTARLALPPGKRTRGPGGKKGWGLLKASLAATGGGESGTSGKPVRTAGENPEYAPDGAPEDISYGEIFDAVMANWGEVCGLFRKDMETAPSFRAHATRWSAQRWGRGQTTPPRAHDRVGVAHAVADAFFARKLLGAVERLERSRGARRGAGRAGPARRAAPGHKAAQRRAGVGRGGRRGRGARRGGSGDHHQRAHARL